MATRDFCDSCGNEIPPYKRHHASAEPVGHDLRRQSNAYLCESCVKPVYDLLRRANENRAKETG